MIRKGDGVTLIRTLVSTFVLAACLNFCCQVYFAQPLDADLLNRRVTLQVKEGTLLEALNRLSQESIPIGWEVAQSDSITHDINLDLNRVALKEVLDRLVLANPAYHWKLENGVINFYPAFDRDERLEVLLSVRIKEFRPSKGLDLFAFRDAILDLPEVQRFLQAKGLEASHGGNCCAGGVPSLDGEFQTANTDLRELLNKLIRDGHRRMWILSRSGEGRQYLNLAL
jgi:hypothetical protein